MTKNEIVLTPDGREQGRERGLLEMVVQITEREDFFSCESRFLGKIVSGIV